MSNSIRDKFPYPKGSEWRKWDLHIHTPASFMWIGAKDDDAYKKVIMKINKSDIKVFVITDYWTFEGYKKIIKINEKLPEEEKLKKVIFPGIELRFDILTDNANDKTRVNFQVVLNNSGTNNQIINRINQFYNQLQLSSTDKIISRESFIEIAKTYSDDVLQKLVGKVRTRCKPADYYLAGLKSCFVSYDCLLKILKNNDLKSDLLIIVPWDKYGGISKVDSILRDDVKKNLTKLANILESTNEDTIKLFLLDKELLSEKDFSTSWEQFLDKKQKPCVCGSDAKSLSGIGSFPNNMACWIKADTTFEGLKQIIFEPEERVKIQTNSPVENNKKVFFNSLELSEGKKFIIPNIKVPLNRELVAVIGGRGSGKSAILESIAFLNEEHGIEDRNGKKKIIEYYRQNVDNLEPSPQFSLTVELVDKDGNTEEYTKSLEDIKNLELPYLYIGQEQLSEIATNDRELTKNICELIGLDFAELQKTDVIEKARTLLAQIKNIKQQLVDIQSKYSNFKTGNFIKWIENHIDIKENQKKRLSSKATKSLLNKITKLVDKEFKLNNLSAKLSSLSQGLKGIEINEEIKDINRELQSVYGKKEGKIPLIDILSLDKIIRAKSNRIKRELKEIKTEITNYKEQLSKMGLKEDVGVLLQSSEAVQKEINNAIAAKEEYTDKKYLIGKLTKKRNLLFTDTQKGLERGEEQINTKFLEFKESRKESEPNEMELFKRTIKGVSIEGEIAFDQSTFCKYILERCLDKRTIRNSEDLKAEIAGKKEDGGSNDITLKRLSSWIENKLDNFLASGPFVDEGKNLLTDFLFTRWSEFLTVKAVAKLDGVPTEKLSIGQRGTLLLKVYLATASAKQIFIVDQPEDNLDNRFIMNDLVPLIRHIKKSRQIILSTHNANLVVNADSEQIIVALLDMEENDYISGSIENPIINKSIKEILEGGEEAFRRREEKYGLV